MLIQIATALAIGAYVVLSKDAQPKRPHATPRESFDHPPISYLIATVVHKPTSGASDAHLV